MISVRVAKLLAYSTLAAVSMVQAQPAMPPAMPVNDALTLAASAAIEVPYDIMSITLSTTREGSDAAAVQSQLRQALDAALTEARKAQRPGQLDVRTGAFSLSPRYGSKSPNITGWTGQAELVLEGRDMSAIAQLAGRFSTLTMARVGYSLARETRERSKPMRRRRRSPSSARALPTTPSSSATRATRCAKSTSARRATDRAADAACTQMAAAGADESIPVEAGKATVTVQVNGSVQMTR